MDSLLGAATTPSNIGSTLDAGAHKTSNLCNECSAALRFDDAQLGGYEGQSEHGEPVLMYKEDSIDRTVGQRELAGGIKFLSTSSICDELPNLPRLAASAESGCGFCGEVRDGVRQFSLAFSGDIRLSFRYSWNTEVSVGEYSLCHLTVEIDAGHEETHSLGNGEMANTVSFLEAENLTTSTRDENTLTFIVEPGEGKLSNRVSGVY